MTNIPGLTNDSICDLIEKYLQDNYSGDGSIVELGTFLGKVTHSLAKVIEMKSFNTKVYTYDQYQWNSNHKRKFPNVNVEVGECFLHLSKKNVISKNVNFKKTLIEELEYEGRKVEILVLDAPKNFNEIKNTFIKFSKYFLNKKTKVIFLDYFLSIKYDTQLFLKMVEDYIDVEFYGDELVVVKIKKNMNNIDYLEQEKKLKKKFKNRKNIQIFWLNLFEKIPENKKKILSILPALFYYKNNFYIESFIYLLKEDCYVQKKYILIKQMIKKYKILNIFLLFLYLRGKFY